ncbi:MAG: ATP-binding protein [Leptolyngbyaceae cyanobacterium bins.302]|nr:ATP-binding protein [Leptolyngbyaceae cyanobacterium bins.302]
MSETDPVDLRVDSLSPVVVLNLELEQQWQTRMANLQRSLELAQVLRQVTDQIRSSLDFRTVLTTIVQEVQKLLNTDRVVMYQFGQDWMGEVVVEAVREPWNSILGKQYQDDCFPADHGQQYLDGRVRAIEDVALSELATCHKALLQTMQVQANLVVPIRVVNQLWGLLIAHECAAPRTWQAFELDLLQQLADQAALALHQAELYEQSCTAAATATAQAQQLQQVAAELTQALQTLQKTQSQLVQTEKMSSLGQLVAGIAHEINNPVSFIYGNLSFVASYTQSLMAIVSAYQESNPQPNPRVQAVLESTDLAFLKQDFPKVLASMKMGVDRIQQIVRSLRNFSRHDEAEKKQVDLHEGIDNTLLILQHRLKAVGNQPEIQVIKQYDDLPLVECYAGQLNQVFMNLLSNAIDALESGVGGRAWEMENQSPPPPKIHIHTSLIDPDRVLICIADNGVGMDETVQARLFDPFFTTKPVGKGTGLGLAISYQIVVEKHHGSIQCYSKPGQGTEFAIEIPVGGIHS